MPNNHTSHENLENLETVWDVLVPYGTSHMFSHGSLIYMPGDPAHTLYIVQAGQVSLYLISSDGRVLTLQVVEPGHIFGHSVLDGSKTYDTFAEAMTPVKTMAVERASLTRALANQPTLGLVMVQALGHYMVHVSRRLDEVAFKSVSARLASVLLDMVEETASSSGPQLRLPRRTHQQLADMTNSYRETVTKIINQFRADNLLTMDRSGITLLNMSRLREVARGTPPPLPPPQCKRDAAR